MRKITRTLLAPALVLFLVFAISVSGCSMFMSKLPTVISAVTDGMLVLDSIEAFERTYFIAHPDAARETEVEALISKSRTALDAALRAANAAGELDQAQIDAALADFKGFYSDLITLVGPIGVKTSATATVRLQATSSGLLVPQPLAFTLRMN
jgi:hypothetical protein